MNVDRIIEDKELGCLLVHANARAKRLTFRTKEDAIYVTVPLNTSLTDIKKVIEQLRPRLKSARQKLKRPLIDLAFRLDTDLFELSLVSGQQEHFLSRSKPGKLQLICPPHVDFANPELQAWLRKVIEEALRRDAKTLLPPRLQMLSAQHQLPYKNVKINSSNGRWGSCSAQGNINLSYFLLLLPQHLIDYVLLHELAHTQEMNHGERFWALLDKMTNHRSQALRAEVKKYHTSF